MKKVFIRDESIDLLKGLSVVFVIVIHTSAQFLSIGYASKSYYLLIFLDLLSQFAVPLFFIISGFLEAASIDRNGLRIISFYKKRAMRIVPLYLLFISIYWFLFKPIDTVNIASILKSITYGTPAYYHFWFIPSLLFVYFLTPVVYLISKELKAQSMFKLSIIMLPVFAAIAPIFTGRFYTIFLPISFLFFILGFSLKNIKFTDRVIKLAIIISFISLFITFLSWSHFGVSESVFLTRPDWVKSIEFFFISISNIILALLFFTKRKYLLEKVRQTKIIKNFGNLSLEIYLIHAMFITLISKYLIMLNIGPTKYYYFIVIFFGTFFTSYALARILKSLKIVASRAK